MSLNLGNGGLFNIDATKLHNETVKITGGADVTLNGTLGPDVTVKIISGSVTMNGVPDTSDTFDLTDGSLHFTDGMAFMSAAPKIHVDWANTQPAASHGNFTFGYPGNADIVSFDLPTADGGASPQWYHGEFRLGIADHHILPIHMNPPPAGIGAVLEAVQDQSDVASGTTEFMIGNRDAILIGGNFQQIT